MKKYLAAILAAILVFAVMAFPALADSVKLTLTGPGSVAAGDTAVVKLSIEGSYKASVVNLMIEFDKTAFSFEGYEFGSAGSEYSNKGICFCELTADGSAVSFGAMFSTDPISAEGELVSLTFRALSGASSTEQFTVKVEELGYMPVNATTATDIDYTAEPLSIAVSGGTGAPDTTAAPGEPTAAPADPTAAPGEPTAAPGEPTAAPADPTDKADPTDDSGNKTKTAEPTDPDDSAAPGETTEDPDTSADPAETEDPEGSADPAEPTSEPIKPEPGRQQKTVKTVLIVLGSILGAALLCVCGLLIFRSIKERRNRR